MNIQRSSGKVKTAGTWLRLGPRLSGDRGTGAHLDDRVLLAALGLPLWASFGLVGALVVGSGVYLRGQHDSCRPRPNCADHEGDVAWHKNIIG
jgi:hypothetical protein